MDEIVVPKPLHDAMQAVLLGRMMFRAGYRLEYIDEAGEMAGFFWSRPACDEIGVEVGTTFDDLLEAVHEAKYGHVVA